MCVCKEVGKDGCEGNLIALIGQNFSHWQSTVDGVYCNDHRFPTCGANFFPILRLASVCAVRAVQHLRVYLRVSGPRLKCV